MSEHKVDDLQLEQLKVEWVHLSEVRPNQYNPNTMTPQDRALLRQSLLEDGWTQPIVVLMDGTIVDGEQRWTVAGMPITAADVQVIIDKMDQRKRMNATVSESIMQRLYRSKEKIAQAEAETGQAIVCSITSELVPITRVDFQDDAHKMISTIRHNRARGVHRLDSMASITSDLIKLGIDFQELETRLGMNVEEAERLLQQVELPDAIKLDDEFSKSWVPVHISELADGHEAVAALQRSEEAAAHHKVYQRALVARNQSVQAEIAARIARLEADQEKAATAIDRQLIEEKVEREIARVPKPAVPVMKRVLLFVTEDEYALIELALAQFSDKQAQALVMLAEYYLKAEGVLNGSDNKQSG